MKKSLLFLMFYVLLGVGLLQAQTVRITGTVTGADDGNPIPGVSVLVKGTTVGTTTNTEGKYELNVPTGQEAILFSFVGYKAQEIQIGGRSIIDVILESESIQVEELVVTAMGIKREKKAVGYSVSEVKSDDLLNAKESNVISALSGKVAGVKVSTTSGQPGSSARIVIRGESSITGQNQPLFVIDGVPFDNTENSIKSTLDRGASGSTGADIDPNNIESMTILKGASASALYGSSAANGVVLITTKSGKKGQAMRVNVSHTISFDKIIEQPLQDIYAQGTYNWTGPGKSVNYFYIDGETSKTSLSWGPKIKDTPGANNYNRWDIFKVGQTNETSAAISGGTDKASYFVSLNNYNQNGTLEGVNFKRKSLLFKGSYQLTDKLNIKVSMGYTRTDNFRVFEGNSPVSFMNSTLAAPASYNLYPGVDEMGNQRIYRPSARNNPYWLLNNTGNPSNRNRFNNSIELSYKLNSKFNVIYRLGQDSYDSKEESYVNLGTVTGAGTSSYDIFNIRYSSYNSDLIVQYDSKIGQDFGVNALVGHNLYTTKTLQDGIYGKEFMVNSMYNIANCQSKDPFSTTYMKRKVGVYGNFILSYKSLLFYTFTARNDWSSTLPSDKNSYFYPSHSLGFLFSELMPKNSILNYAKLNLSYAIVGNDAPAYNTLPILQMPGVYDPYRGQLKYPFLGVGSFVESASGYNGKLKNELIKEKEIGLDLKMLNNRLGLNIAMYEKSSESNIMSAPVDPSSGYNDVILNVGKLQNRGMEIQVTAIPVKIKDFEWEVVANYSFNRSEVKQMAPGVNTIQLGGFTGEGPFIVLGEAYPVIYGTKFVRDANGNKVVDDDTDQWLVDQSKTGPIAKVEPNWIGGLRNTFTYKGFSLSAFIDVKVGGHVYNLDEHYLEFYGMSLNTKDRPDDMLITLAGQRGHLDNNGNLVITSPNNTNVTDYGALHRNQLANVTEYGVQGAGYIKFRELSLSYSLPKKILSKLSMIKGANISLSGRNLWAKYEKDFTGGDPEGSLSGSGNSQGIINYMMPNTKSFSVGLKFEF